MHPRSVLFVAEPAADNPMRYYRAVLPMKGLRALGWQCHIAPILMNQEDGRVYGYTPPGYLVPGAGLAGGAFSPPCKYVVLRRMVNPDQGRDVETGDWRDVEIDSVDMFGQARRAGQFIFLDFDDDLWEVPEWHPARKQLGHKDMSTMKRNMAASDCVIVSTPELGHALSRRVDPQVGIAVCRNGVDPDAYFPHCEHFPLRIIWPGTLRYKAPDFSFIVPALRRALAGLRDVVELWHLGQHPGCDTILADLCGDDFPVRIRERPWVAAQRLPGSLAMGDIGILPHLDNPFNRARSWTGPMSLAAAGIPWIGSPLPEYLRMEAGAIARDADQWALALGALIESHIIRQEIARHGLEVAAAHDPVTTARQYVEVFEGTTLAG